MVFKMLTKILSVADQDWTLIELGQRIRIKVQQAKMVPEKENFMFRKLDIYSEVLEDSLKLGSSSCWLNKIILGMLAFLIRRSLDH
jgi:hypothetical protein